MCLSLKSGVSSASIKLGYCILHCCSFAPLLAEITAPLTVKYLDCRSVQSNHQKIQEYPVCDPEARRL